MPTNSRGKSFNEADADLIFQQLQEQKRILKIEHSGSWTNDDDLLMRDAAEILAGFGVASLYDLQAVYTDTNYVIESEPLVNFDYGDSSGSYGGQNFVSRLISPAQEQSDPEGGTYYLPAQYERLREATPADLAEFEKNGKITVTEWTDTINRKTRQRVPLNELNNRRGDGFTWYTINFHGGIPVMVAWKEKTGLGKLTQQIGKFLSTPGFQIFILALNFIPIAPGMGSILSNIANSIGTSAMNAIGINAAANPMLTKIVGDAAIRTVTSGGDLEKALTMAVAGDPLRDLVGFVGSEVSSLAYDIGELNPQAAKIVGDVASTAVRAEILGGSIPQALAINVGADIATEGIKQVSSIFDDDSLGTGLVYTPGPDLGFQAYGNVFDDITETSSIGLDEIDYWDIGVTNDGTMIGISTEGTVIAETIDGKSFDVSSIWDDLPSLDDLNKTLKGLTQLAVTGATLTNIIEGKPATPATRPPAGTVVRNADGSTTTYNANGTVTRRLADGRIISSTTNAQQQAQIENLTPLLAIGGAALLLAS